MTDNEIIEVLEICSNIVTSGCRECRLHSMYNANCVVQAMRNALDLINRQKAEIEKLRNANGLMQYLKKAVHRVEIDGKAEVVEYASEEALYDAITKRIYLMSNVQTSMTEARKEFEERLKLMADKISIAGIEYQVITTESLDIVLAEMEERECEID